MDIIEERVEVAGIETFVRRAGDARILYLHGVPTNSDDWVPFLERTGGVAVDLPGFGRSGKPNTFGYSIEGYADWLGALLGVLGWESYRLLVHDWGGVGLALAQRRPERVERLAVLNCVVLLPGYRWHRWARIWRTPVLGELFQGSTTRFAVRWILREAKAGEGGMPDHFVDSIWDHYDHGTQRAILRLYRSAPPEVLAAAGARLGEIKAPALVLYGVEDPYIDARRFGPAYAEALGGPVELELAEGAGHWPWIDRPELIDRVCDFLS